MATAAMDFENLAKEISAAYNAHDLEKFLSFHTDDVLMEHVVAGGLVCRGKEEFKANIKEGFESFPDITVELTGAFGSGNHQCEVCIFTGTHRGAYLGIAPTGKRVSIRSVIVRELRDGKCCRVSMYFDSASFLG